MAKKARFTCKKYDGDDLYSWAVFRCEDVKGLLSPIVYGQANPVVSGCSKSEAIGHKKFLEKKFEDNHSGCN